MSEFIKKDEKILMLLLPYWTPLMPPLGISSLKSFLEPQGYQITTVDFNVEAGFWDLYHKYFAILEKEIPTDKRGNFYNIGNNVLRHHLMAHFNKEADEGYFELIQIVVEKYFFSTLEHTVLAELEQVILEIYSALEQHLLKIVTAENPGLVGISVYTGTLAPSLFAFRLLKDRFPAIKTVMGGGIFADELALDSENFQNFLKRVPYIDKIIAGEGEIQFLKLLRGELPEIQRVFTLSDIGHETVDLATLEIPDFSDFDLKQYPHCTAFTSRSCPFQCSFCSETVQWGKYRRKNAQQVLQELSQLNERYGSQIFLLGDSLLNPIITELAQEMINNECAFYWDGYLRADLPVCDLNNTLLWRKGGFYRARLGVESGSQKVLDLMGKKITPAQIEKAITSLARAGIKTTTYWVIGYPGETEEAFSETLGLIETLRNEIYEAECNPFNYFLTGQVGSDKLSNEYQVKPLFQEDATQRLLTQTWTLDAEPPRKITYERVSRFIEHCRKLGIPNPYSLREIYQADERWSRLHENAVPPLAAFRNGVVDEKRDWQLMDRQVELLSRIKSSKKEIVVDFDY